MTWPLAAYDKLTSSIHKFLYKTLKLYLGFPKHLLHLPTHLGGFGIPDLFTYDHQVLDHVPTPSRRLLGAAQH